MWWQIILICVFIILIYLMVAPFFIEIDTDLGLFRVRFHQLVSASLILTDDIFLIELKITAWKKQIAFTKASVGSEVNKKKKQSKASIQKMYAVLKSFRVRKFFLSVDTGDVQVNGILYPIFVLMSAKTGKNMTINFLNENRLVLQMENNVIRVLWSYINS